MILPSLEYQQEIMKSMQHWEELNRRLLQKTRVFDLLVSTMRCTEKNYEDEFYFIQAPDWVNIIALTEKREVVLVRQHRFGIQNSSLELPGGIIDKGETPKQAALRELEEETGYVARDAVQIGFVHPNPALQNNKAFSFLAENVRLEKEQNLDQAESIVVETAPLSAIPALVHRGEITHSLIISAFFHLFQGTLK